MLAHLIKSVTNTKNGVSYNELEYRYTKHNYNFIFIFVANIIISFVIYKFYMLNLSFNHLYVSGIFDARVRLAEST